MSLRRYRPGPGMMVSAAFIGPGTVTACTLAGAQFGYALAWALVFATVATIILQGYAVRIALCTGRGLAENFVARTGSGPMRWFAVALLLTALAMGNAAYEAGNISGSMLGIEAIGGDTLSDSARNWVIFLVGALAAMAVLAGTPKFLEKVLITMVVVMSLSFVLVYAMTRPDPGELLTGMIPTLPGESLLTAIALIGTTIVPYNLFLHAASLREKAIDPADLSTAQTESAVSIGIGGLISIFILATAASAFLGQEQNIANARDMAQQMRPVFGAWSGIALGVGLFAAGMTSAITAPMATGFIVREIVGSSSSPQSPWIFKGAALLVIAIGVVVALSGASPVQIIMLAQIANGILLPFIVVVMLRMANDRQLLGERVNTAVDNLIGGLLLIVVATLGFRMIARAVGLWP
jgi:NRAMP (natural resistance-associated macrophage protein)-like metal ion transporter